MCRNVKKEFITLIVTKLNEMQEKIDNQLQEMRKSFYSLKEELHKGVDTGKRSRS